MHYRTGLWAVFQEETVANLGNRVLTEPMKCLEGTSHHDQARGQDLTLGMDGPAAGGARG